MTGFLTVVMWRVRRGSSVYDNLKKIYLIKGQQSYFLTVFIMQLIQAHTEHDILNVWCSAVIIWMDTHTHTSTCTYCTVPICSPWLVKVLPLASITHWVGLNDPLSTRDTLLTWREREKQRDREREKRMEGNFLLLLHGSKNILILSSKVSSCNGNNTIRGRQWPTSVVMTAFSDDSKNV